MADAEKASFPVQLIPEALTVFRMVIFDPPKVSGILSLGANSQ